MPDAAKDCLLARSDAAAVETSPNEGPGQRAAFDAAAGVKNGQPWITPRTHAIDATDNIDHLTRRALVRI